MAQCAPGGQWCVCVPGVEGVGVSEGQGGTEVSWLEQLCESSRVAMPVQCVSPLNWNVLFQGQD